MLLTVNRMNCPLPLVVEAVRRNAHTVGYCGNAITTLRDLTDGFFLKFMYKSRYAYTFLLVSRNWINARVLLQMSEVINQHPEREKYIRPLPDAHRQILAAMVVRRRLLTITLASERNRLHPSHPQGYESIRSIISALKSELVRIEGEMVIHIKGHFSELYDLLSTVKRVGAATVAMLKL
ncbi:Uncharacterised protein [Enterobacter cancerogenus]|uniref:Uncharacterized protein n=1 Tax=Enterobacter cancerogenus TaxID=69218 RepID=A0A484WXU3_9ENTR|nr:Uncharacterised protein [Enterobacter cancerogenus]